MGDRNCRHTHIERESASRAFFRLRGWEEILLIYLSKSMYIHEPRQGGDDRPVHVTGKDGSYGVCRLGVLDLG